MSELSHTEDDGKETLAALEAAPTVVANFNAFIRLNEKAPDKELCSNYDKVSADEISILHPTIAAPTEVKKRTLEQLGLIMERRMLKRNPEHYRKLDRKGSHYAKFDQVHSGGRVMRNEPCPCRSGKKAKKCCFKN